jgi:hypothetical protein
MLLRFARWDLPDRNLLWAEYLTALCRFINQGRPTNGMGIDVNKPLWQPHNTHETNTAKFISFVNKRHSLELQSYEDLYRWSVGDTSFDDFWRDAYEWLELAPAGSKKIGRMLQNQVIREEQEPRATLWTYGEREANKIRYD